MHGRDVVILEQGSSALTSYSWAEQLLARAGALPHPTKHHPTWEGWMGQLWQVWACWQPAPGSWRHAELRQPLVQAPADAPSLDLLRHAELGQPQAQTPAEPAEDSAACLAQGCLAPAGCLPSQGPACFPTGSTGGWRSWRPALPLPEGPPCMWRALELLPWPAVLPCPAIVPWPAVLPGRLTWLHRAVRPHGPDLLQLPVRVLELGHAEDQRPAPALLLELVFVQACVAGVREWAGERHQRAAVKVLQRAGVQADHLSLLRLPPSPLPQDGGVLTQAAAPQGVFQPSCRH